MTTCLLGLGANLGDRAATLERAVAELRSLPQSRLLAVSRWHETSAVGGPSGQGDFLNGAARLETALSAAELLDQLQAIERELGRCRSERWGARTIDLDLLLHGDTRLASPAVQVPHPRLAVRRFVLEPASEVAADLVDPATGWSIGRLLEHLNTAPGYVAIAAVPGAARRQLAEALAAAWRGRLLVDVDIAQSATSHLPANVSGEAKARTLQSRAARLTQATWPETRAVRRAGKSVAVSEFWLGEAMLADRQIDEAPAAEARRAEIAAGCVSPLFVVAYDLAATGFEGAAGSDSPFDSWRAALREELERGWHGPVLWFDGRPASKSAEANFDEPFDEIISDLTAAIAGMR